MKMLNVILITGVLVGGGGHHTRAQPPRGPGFGGPFGMGADKLMLASQPSVRQELKLSDKQVKQLDQRREKQRAAFEELRDLELEDAAKKIAKQAKSNDAVLGKILNADQFKRLSEISLQQRGARALTDPEVARSLGLTGAQKNKLQDILDESQEEMQKLFAQLGGPGGPGGPGRQGVGRPGLRGGPRQGPDDGAPPNEGGNANPAGRVPGGPGGPRGAGPGTPEEQAARQENFKKLDALRKNADEKMIVVLNEKQQTKWQAMQGEPFKGEIGPPNFQRGARPDGPPPDDSR
jgi:hypothetical protein